MELLEGSLSHPSSTSSSSSFSRHQAQYTVRRAVSLYKGPLKSTDSSIHTSVVCAQLMLGNMFVVAIMVRNWMGSSSNGTNGIQKWHAESVSLSSFLLVSLTTRSRRFAFLLASSTSALIVACVLSDVHHIHGFGRKEHLHQFQSEKAALRMESRSDRAEHPLFRRSDDSLWQRLRKFFGRRQAVILFVTFTSTEVFW